MKAILDTCIIVDVLQNREPFSQDAKSIFLLCANQQFEGFLTAKAITDIYNLTHRQTHNDKASRDVLIKLCSLFELLDTKALDIHNAIFAEVSDFEDAVMIETAIRSNVDCIVTRNQKDYNKAPIPVYTPSEFVELINKESEDLEGISALFGGIG
jgi:predicted nucleic acid-binding protein